MSDIEQKDNSIKTTVPEVGGYQDLGLFKGNEGLLFAFKKSQKLAAAIYLVTDLISEEEKLRRDLRELSVALAKDILSSVTLRGILPSLRILEIISLLEIASGARLISPMNAGVLKREYEQVLEAVAKAESRLLAPSLTLPEDLLKFETHPSVPSPLPVSTVMERTQTSSGVSVRKDVSIGQSSLYGTDRSLSILDLIKKSPQPLSIKDISAHIRGVGEKTIQRELGGLVARGVLKREGERRWSRYSLR